MNHPMTKPFNPTLPVQTRDGRKARIVCADCKKPGYPILALLTCGRGEEHHEYYAASGKFSLAYPMDEARDLINVPTKRKGWIALRPTHGGGSDIIADATEVYETREQALHGLPREQWQIIQIEFDE